MNRIASAPLVALLLLAAAAPVRGEEPPAPAPAQTKAPPPAPEPHAPATNADDVNYQIETARPRPAGLLPNGPVSILDPLIDDLNASAKRKYGLEFGAAYTAVYQDASDGDVDHGGAGDGDLFARWRLLGEEKSGWRGVAGVNLEGRHDFGENTPRDLGDSFGSLWRTTNNFGTQEFDAVQVWWEQHLLDDRVVATAGKIDPTDYYDTHRYQNDSKAFLSRAFSNNPTRGHPNNGLGATARAKLPGSFEVAAGFHDANAVKTNSGFKTVGELEWFYAAEFAWVPRLERLGRGEYRLTFWSVDERDDDGVPSDDGVALSTAQEVGRGFVPFFRASFADGNTTGVERFVCGGLGLEGVLGTKEDLTGIGISWGEPEDSVRRKQWGGEIFHRFQFAPDVQFTVGYQYIRSPSDPTVDGDDPVGVIEFRVRIQF